MLRLALALLFASASATSADNFFASLPATPVVSYAQLSTLSPTVGALAYITDCRAIVSVSGLAIVTQFAGTGTGCMGSYNGTVWQIDGTTIPVAR